VRKLGRWCSATAASVQPCWVFPRLR
jgi:hypothetical protein